ELDNLDFYEIDKDKNPGLIKKGTIIPQMHFGNKVVNGYSEIIDNYNKFFSFLPDSLENLKNPEYVLKHADKWRVTKRMEESGKTEVSSPLKTSLME
ncbi:MAG: hypothetical protein KC414_15240, partial [Romboutsia sp.]|nr:hypothetical protein [Romboutsia sp.]